MLHTNTLCFLSTSAAIGKFLLVFGCKPLPLSKLWASSDVEAAANTDIRYWLRTKAVRVNDKNTDVQAANQTRRSCPADLIINAAAAVGVEAACRKKRPAAKASG